MASNIVEICARKTSRLTYGWEKKKKKRIHSSTVKQQLVGESVHVKKLNVSCTIRGLLEKYPTVFFYANT